MPEILEASFVVCVLVIERVLYLDWRLTLSPGVSMYLYLVTIRHCIGNTNLFDSQTLM